MNCLQCDKKLSLKFHIHGKGECAFCKAKQKIKVKHTAVTVAIVMLIGVFGPFSLIIKILISLAVGVFYLIFSKTEIYGYEKMKVD